MTTTVQPKQSTPKELNPEHDLNLDREREQQIVDRINDKNTSADYGSRSGRTNKTSGSGIDIAGPGGK
jgi:hypothetical protein